jgi:hypothetical protein
MKAKNTTKNAQRKAKNSFIKGLIILLIKPSARKVRAAPAIAPNGPPILKQP